MKGVTVSSKKTIARLCTAFLVFFSCAGWKKQELAESFDWEKEILTRRGYHYQKTNDYEELDTGKWFPDWKSRKTEKENILQSYRKKAKTSWIRQKEKDRHTMKELLIP